MWKKWNPAKKGRKIKKYKTENWKKKTNLQNKKHEKIMKKYINIKKRLICQHFKCSRRADRQR